MVDGVQLFDSSNLLIIKWYMWRRLGFLEGIFAQTPRIPRGFKTAEGTPPHRFFFYSNPPKVFNFEYFLANTFYKSSHLNTEFWIHFPKKRLNLGEYFCNIFKGLNSFCRILFRKMTLANKNCPILFSKTTSAIKLHLNTLKKIFWRLLSVWW